MNNNQFFFVWTQSSSTKKLTSQEKVLCAEKMLQISDKIFGNLVKTQIRYNENSVEILVYPLVTDELKHYAKKKSKQIIYSGFNGFLTSIILLFKGISQSHKAELSIKLEERIIMQKIKEKCVTMEKQFAEILKITKTLSNDSVVKSNQFF